MSRIEFERKVYTYIKDNHMIDSGDVVVLGLSGGADSVCLFRILIKLFGEYRDEGKELSLKVVHVNHMIRETANRDEEFVRRLCETNNIELTVYKKDVLTLARENHLSTEEAGRKVRYEAFYETGKKSLGKVVVAVAHNLNDNSETILFNMFRGSALKGIAGIEPVNETSQGVKIIRPLLKVTREEIEEYLEEIGQDFVTDETNFSDEYTRNIIRNNILPLAKDKVNKRVVENVTYAGDFVAKAYEYIRKEVDVWYKEIVIKEENKVYIDKDKFMGLDEIIQDEIIKEAMANVCGQAKDLTQAHIKSVREIFQGVGNKEISLPYKMVARQVYDKLCIEQVWDKNNESEKESGCKKTCQLKGEVVVSKKDLEEKRKCEVEFGGEKYGFTLFDLENISEIDKSYIKNLINEKNNYTKCFDYGKILGSLVLRTHKEGDYITFSKDGGQKKLGRFFIDNKIPARERENLTLLTCDKEIIWIVPIRTGCSAYVDESTKRVLVVSRF